MRALARGDRPEAVFSCCSVSWRGRNLNKDIEHQNPVGAEKRQTAPAAMDQPFACITGFDVVVPKRVVERWLEQLLAQLQASEHDKFAAHLYQVRREFRHFSERPGKGSKAVERTVISSFQVAPSLGFLFALGSTCCRFTSESPDCASGRDCAKGIVWRRADLGERKLRDFEAPSGRLAIKLQKPEKLYPFGRNFVRCI